MLAACKSFLSILLVLVICLIGSAPIYSQSSSALDVSKSPGRGASSGAWLAKCNASPVSTLAGRRFSEAREWPAAGNATPGDFSVPNAPEAPCVESAPAATPRAAADNPCPESVAGAPSLPSVPGVPRNLSCNDSADTVLAQLSALGKDGVKIARAREEVLDILHSENACTEWFATKDATPAATFQSLSFLLDNHGPYETLESRQADSSVFWKQPYVARAMQDSGAYTAITINAHGAFYRQQGSVLKIIPEGGPVRAHGTRLLTVGSYPGDTLPAQMVTLLHEFGHIIDLLPEDADNLDGKSVRNTDDVLRHCRAEVEARSQRARQAAKR